METQAKQGLRGRIEQKWLALAVVCAGTLLPALNVGIVGVALPTISSSLNVDLTAVGWIQLSYQLTITGLSLTLGRLADNIGRKRMFVAGFAISTMGTFLSPLSNSLTNLIGARVIQGIGTAMLAANNRAVLTFAFPARERGRAMSVMQVASGGGTAVALGISGMIIAWLSWQGVFWALVPLGVAGTVLTIMLLEEQRSQGQSVGVNWVGAILLLGTVSFLLFCMTQIPTGGWTSPSLQLSAIGFVLCASGLYWEERRSKLPLMEWRLLLRSRFGRPILASFLSQAARSAVLFLAPFQLERAFGTRATQTGLLLLAFPLAELAFAPLSGWWSDHSGPQPPTSFGMLIATLCLLILGSTSKDSGVYVPVTLIALLGLGLGLFHSANNAAVMGAAPVNQLSSISSFLATNITLGMAAGVALASTILASRLIYHTSLGLGSAEAFGMSSRDTYLVIMTLTLIALFLSLGRERKTNSVLGEIQH